MSTSADEMAVAQILLANWDPVGVREVDVDPESEYLFEAAEIIRLLRGGIDRPGLIAHLTTQQRALGGDPAAERDRLTADALFDWWATTTSA